MAKVVIKSNDSKRFEIEEAVAKKSQLLKNMIEGTPIRYVDTGAEEEIFLPNVKGSVLSKVFAYCEHYRDTEPKEIEKPLPKNTLTDLVSAWDEQFISQGTQEEILELILASNYLDIKSLLELSCAKVATMIKGKSPEEIRETFGIINDFTPEEENQIREENKWAEESSN
jgi:S-phase kinase-associated protein 1